MGESGEAHSWLLFKLPVEDEQLDYGVTETDIANTDPRVELEDDVGEAREEVGNLVGGEDQNDVIILDQAPGNTEVVPVSDAA